jgi:alcohol dehydrogenase
MTMSSMHVAAFLCPTRVLMGLNAHVQVEEVLNGWRSERLFIAVDRALVQSEMYLNVLAILKRIGVRFSIFTEIEPDPSAHTVAKAFEVCRADSATALLAIGGGSTIDVAKAVGILATNGGRIHDYEGIEKFSTPPLPLLAIPTTAGTGSEVSGSCVITDTDRNLKMSIRHAALNPAKVAVLDPLAVRTLPATVAAHSGMDAFVHAFESYLSLNGSPMTDGLNLYAIELISRHLRSFVANRNNLEAGLNMLCGSCLAGMTFGLTGLGNVHCMARFVGAFFHVSHGLSIATCLPYAAEFNLLANPGKYARIAHAMGEDVHGLSDIEAGRRALRAIGDLCRDLGIPSTLREIGATEDALPVMARLCTEANYNRWNPRHTTYEDFLALFRTAYAGREMRDARG